MRIVTLNANGIRSAARKGFFDWLQKQDADVVCVQETKAQNDQLVDPISDPSGYHSYYFDASRRATAAWRSTPRQAGGDRHRLRFERV